MLLMRIGASLLTSLIAATALLAASAAQAAITIHIDKSAQRMTVSVDGATRYVWPVSTGRAGYDTPSGTFKINRLDADHQSQEWDGAPMPHTMFFDLRGHAIHGFFDVKHLGQPVSHGCVRLAPANAATLFAMVQTQGMKETTVIVSGQAPRGGEEIARRRAPAQEAAVQPQVPPPGYDATTLRRAGLLSATTAALTVLRASPTAELCAAAIWPAAIRPAAILPAGAAADLLRPAAICAAAIRPSAARLHPAAAAASLCGATDGTVLNSTVRPPGAVVNCVDNPVNSH
jgi:hypothetical protein